MCFRLEDHKREDNLTQDHISARIGQLHRLLGFGMLFDVWIMDPMF